MRYLINISVSFLSLLILCQACKRDDISRPVALSCPLESKSVYQINPKSTQYQALIEEYVKKGLPGIILLVKDDNGFYIGAAGMADIKQGIKLQPCHVSKIASVTKFMLGVTTMRLQEKGILSLDDLVSKYVPKGKLDRIANGNQPITIRSLMNHTTGFYDVINDNNFYLHVLNDPAKHWTSNELLKYVYGKDADFAFSPIDTAGYSNTNYVLLKLSDEAATQKSITRLMHEEVFDPLGLTDTYSFYDDPLPEGRIAQGYFDLYNNGNIENLTYWNTGSGNGYGGVYSTVWDMYVFIDALFVKKTLLNQASLDQMLVFHHTIESRKHLGVSCQKDFIDIGDPAKDYAWGHRGRDLSYTADLFYFPEHHAIMSMMVNYGTDGDSPLKPIFNEMRDKVAKIIVNAN